MNPNLLTLTAPDKGGLTDLNLHGGLTSSPSLPWSPQPRLQVAPHLAVRSLGNVSIPPSLRCLPTCLKAPFVLISTEDKLVGISWGSF